MEKEKRFPPVGKHLWPVSLEFQTAPDGPFLMACTVDFELAWPARIVYEQYICMSITYIYIFTDLCLYLLLVCFSALLLKNIKSLTIKHLEVQRYTVSFSSKLKGSQKYSNYFLSQTMLRKSEEEWF